MHDKMQKKKKVAFDVVFYKGFSILNLLGIFYTKFSIYRKSSINLLLAGNHYR